MRRHEKSYYTLLYAITDAISELKKLSEYLEDDEKAFLDAQLYSMEKAKKYAEEEYE